ncbi:thiamine pyrophosphate-dependent dehydrogenase E1 component subunit alpha [Actinomadura meridiana]|uniref:thiamine pyrophosphate-dependent dehydrogenase E1 component subunit alpha n=1 Tax=Actinomadura meridiana TaxID=559626 RepID=UPI0031EA953B
MADDDLLSMLLTRRFEEELLRMAATGDIRGTTHTCLGQEYIPVALERLLHPDDFVLSHHRGHGHYLARFGDVTGLLAELLGRQGAVCGGVGGSQHIHRPGYLSTGVQGESLPIAVGIALHFKRRALERCAVAYIGDGTWGEGAVYEALNMAALWSVPLVVVVENNGIAQTTPTSAHMAGSIAARAAAFGIAYQRIEGTDIDEIRADLRMDFNESRKSSKPFIVEFVTHRVGPHSKGDDARTAQQIREAELADWYPAYAFAHQAQTREIESIARKQLDDAIEEVRRRPLVSAPRLAAEHAGDGE